MELPFISVDGARTKPQLQLVALSTCGFCKKAMSWLSDRKFSFSYIFLDQIDPQKKLEYKSWFLDKHFQNLSYPALIIDQSDVIVGFIPAVWEEKLPDTL